MSDHQTLDDLRREHGDLVELETNDSRRVVTWWHAPNERVFTCLDCGAVLDHEHDECDVCLEDDDDDAFATTDGDWTQHTF